MVHILISDSAIFPVLTLLFSLFPCALLTIDDKQLREFLYLSILFPFLALFLMSIKMMPKWDTPTQTGVNIHLLFCVGCWFMS